MKRNTHNRYFVMLLLLIIGGLLFMEMPQADTSVTATTWRVGYIPFFRSDSTLITDSNGTISSYPSNVSDTTGQRTDWAYDSSSGTWYHQGSGSWFPIVDIWETGGTDTSVANDVVLAVPVPYDSSVATAAIQLEAVTTARLALNAADSTIVANVYLRHLEDWTTVPMTAGDLMYFDGDSMKILSKGTAGYYLQMGAVAPTWDQINLGDPNVGDVTLSSIIDDQVLRWDGGNGRFENESPNWDSGDMDLTDDFTWTGTHEFDSNVQLDGNLYVSTGVVRKFVWSGNQTTQTVYFPGAEYGDVANFWGIDQGTPIKAPIACETKTDSVMMTVLSATAMDGDSIAVILYKMP